MASTIYSVDLSQVPEEVPCILPENQVKYASKWPKAKKLLDAYPVQRELLEHFFPTPEVTEELKWSMHEDLTAVLKESSHPLTEINLLRQRAVVRLYCGLALHAYSDGELMIRYYTNNEQHVREAGAFDMILDAKLICLLAAMTMYDQGLIRSLAHDTLNLYFQSSRHYSHMQPQMIHFMTMNMNSAIEKGFQPDDHYLDAFFALYDLIEATGLILRIIDASAETQLPLSRSIAIQLRILFLLQHDLKHRLNTGVAPASQHAVPLSMSTMLLQDRSSSPDGDRNPNNVLRTLFTLCRSSMQFIRVMVDSEKGGFKLVAKTDIANKEAFLAEAPLVNFVNPHAGDPHCDYCMKSISGQRCSCQHCGDLYCSTACKDAAYSKYHQALCIGSGWHELLKANLFHTVQSSFSFVCCMTIKLMVMANVQGKSSVFEMPEFKILSNTFDCTSPSTSVPSLDSTFSYGGKLVQWFHTFQLHCPKLLPNITLVDFILAYCTVSRNSVGHWNASHTVHEASLNVALSFANHSCELNAIYFLASDTREMLLCATRAIKAGEEITISYINADAEYFVRQATLSIMYGFECHCGKCLRNAVPKKRKGKK